MSQPDSEIEELRAQLRDAQATLARYKTFSEKFDARIEEILYHFFDRDGELAAEDIAAQFGEKVNVAKAYLSTLSSRKMIDTAGSRPLPRYIEEPQKHTMLYRLTTKGTKWAMANRA